jgi:OOP family OmpA-OmpF porin
VELKFDNGTLAAAGAASHRWIADSRKLALAIPGVEAFNDRNLINEDLQAHETLRRRIETRIIRFIMGTTRLVPNQNQELQDLVTDLRKLISLAQAANRTAQIQIIGHTDSEGDDNRNLRLSQERANRMLSLLAARGVDKQFMTAKGVGTTEPLRPETSETGKQFNRSATIKISLVEGGERR